MNKIHISNLKNDYFSYHGITVLAIEFVAFEIEFVPLENEFDTLAIEFIALARKLVMSE